MAAPRVGLKQQFLDRFEGYAGKGLVEQEFVKKAAAVLVKQTNARPLLRKVVEGTSLEDVVVSEAGPSDKVAVVWTAINGEAMLPREVLDTYFAMEGMQAIYLSDPQNKLFFEGIEGLGDTPAALSAGINAILEREAPGKDVIYFGFSGGTFGAVQTAKAVGVKRMILLCPATNVTAANMSRIGDNRARMVLQRLYSTIAEADLKKDAALEELGPDFPVDVVFGEQNVTDSVHAYYLRGKGGVRLRPIKGWSQHNVMVRIVHAGLLPQFVRGNLKGVSGLTAK